MCVCVCVCVHKLQVLYTVYKSYFTFIFTNFHSITFLLYFDQINAAFVTSFKDILKIF